MVWDYEYTKINIITKFILLKFNLKFLVRVSLLNKQ
jgi:hypothetical protein